MTIAYQYAYQYTITVHISVGVKSKYSNFFCIFFLFKLKTPEVNDNLLNKCSLHNKLI